MIDQVSSNSVLQAGLQGFQRASAGVAEAASVIANPNDNRFESQVEGLVSLQENTLNAQAAAEVIDVADETLGRIIDTFA